MSRFQETTFHPAIFNSFSDGSSEPDHVIKARSFFGDVNFLLGSRIPKVFKYITRVFHKVTGRLSNTWSGEFIVKCLLEIDYTRSHSIKAQNSLETWLEYGAKETNTRAYISVGDIVIAKLHGEYRIGFAIGRVGRNDVLLIDCYKGSPDVTRIGFRSIESVVRLSNLPVTIDRQRSLYIYPNAGVARFKWK